MKLFKLLFAMFNLKRQVASVANELANLQAIPVPRNRSERRIFARKGRF